MKILLIEDDERMARLIRRGLTEEGHQVDVCQTGADATLQATTVRYDVLILDWGLPDVDGVSVLRKWRERGMSAPVLMLTARGSVGERVTGLRAGADDYLTKPFDFDELLARIEALRRRAGGAMPSLGSLVIDERRRAFVADGKEQTLTAREWQLWLTFLEHRGDVLTRSELLTRVWGPDFTGEANVVDVYVGYLRAKLQNVGAEHVGIRAVRGVGFRLEVKA